MAAPGPRYRRLDRDERREQILTVARRLFTELPYADVSTTAIARESGVQRGLIHYYFGTKRELFLEVVRHLSGLVAMETAMPPLRDLSLKETVDICVGHFLDSAERNATTWFAAVDAEGFGQDPELARIITRTRDITVERMVEVLRIPAPTDTLRAILRTYSGLVETATREWLQRRSLGREQVHTLLSRSLLVLLNDIAPVVEDAGGDARGMGEAGVMEPVTEPVAEPVEGFAPATEQA